MTFCFVPNILLGHHDENLRGHGGDEAAKLFQ
jgi:hypothetical protein